MLSQFAGEAMIPELYSNLPDMNGVEMCKGDICGLPVNIYGWRDFIGVVTLGKYPCCSDNQSYPPEEDEYEYGWFLRGRCHTVRDRRSNVITRSYEDDWGLWHAKNIIEIIGNRWENPELLASLEQGEE